MNIISLSIGKSGKGLKSHIQTDTRFNRFFNWLMVDNTRESNVPFVGRRFSYCAGLDCAFDRPVKFYFNVAYLRKLDNIFEQLESSLRISKRVISPFSTKSWVSWLFSGFYSAKEGTKSKVNSYRNILKALTENIIQKFVFFLQTGNCIRLVILRETFFIIIPGVLSLLKEMIVQPAASLKRVLELSGLRFIRKYPVFECFSHNVLYIYIEYV